MTKLNTTTYSEVAANTVDGAVLDADKILAWRLDLKNVVDANSPDGQYAADAGSTDAYAVTLAPVPTAYYTGMVVRFKANTLNTSAATLNVNSLGAKTIKKSYNADLETGDIVANQILTVVYDGTNFQLQSDAKAITESGSNANGSYIKFSDGTLLCFGTKILAASYAAEVTVNISRPTYPATFTTLVSESISRISFFVNNDGTGNAVYAYFEHLGVSALLAVVKSSGRNAGGIGSTTDRSLVGTTAALSLSYNFIAWGRWRA